MRQNKLVVLEKKQRSFRCLGSRGRRREGREGGEAEEMGKGRCYRLLWALLRGWHWKGAGRSKQGRDIICVGVEFRGAGVEERTIALPLQWSIQDGDGEPRALSVDIEGVVGLGHTLEVEPSRIYW